MRLPLTLTQFNKHCPPEYRVTGNPSLAQIERIEETKGLPSQFVLEAHTGSQRLLVLLRTDRTLVFLEDGTPVHRMLPNVLNRFSTDEGVVLELVEADEGLYARDVLLWDQFRKESPCPPVEVRLNVLERMLAGQDAVSMVEYILHENTDGVRDDIALFFESGYEGVIFRPLGITYFADHSNILVNPKRRSVLTCTQITEGTGKYAGRAEYVHGRGTMNRKKFETPVFHGLTFSTRESILRGIDDYTGRKFVVRSCGLGEDGMLLFPVFQEWKEDTK